MKKNDIEKLEALFSESTPGPWYVRYLDDEDCVSAIAVSTEPDTGAHEGMREGKWPGDKVVAACLLLSPPYAVINDYLHENNAKLIAEMKNALPELIRLAKIGMTHDI